MPFCSLSSNSSVPLLLPHGIFTQNQGYELLNLFIINYHYYRHMAYLILQISAKVASNINHINHFISIVL